MSRGGAAIVAALLCGVVMADDITVSRSVRSPDGQRKSSVAYRLASGKTSVGLRFDQMMAHNGKPMRMAFFAQNGAKDGICDLINFFGLKVNGIAMDRLESTDMSSQVWDGTDGARGLEAKLNFDGARVALRFYLRPERPFLYCEIEHDRKSDRMTSAVVRFTTLPSHFIVGKFHGYRREIRTARALYGAKPSVRHPLIKEDQYIIFQDADFDGTTDASGKRRGNGPSVLLPDWRTFADGLTDEMSGNWTQGVELRAKSGAETLRFAIWEPRPSTLTNANVEERLGEFFCEKVTTTKGGSK